MQRCDVLIATRNPKTYYHLIRIVKTLNLEFLTCTPDSILANDAKVIVTTNKESIENSDANIISVEENPDPITTSIDIISAYLSISTPNQVVVGVDPGMRFGVALVVDGNVIITKTITSPPSAAKLTQKIVTHTMSKFSEATVSIRLGMGSRLYATLFLRSLGDMIKDIPIELVDEKHTTTPDGYAKDQISAILISNRSGRPMTSKDLHLKRKRGYVRSLRRLVRRLSDGKRKMTVDEARKVLQGETSLEEFI